MRIVLGQFVVDETVEEADERLHRLRPADQSERGRAASSSPVLGGHHLADDCPHRVWNVDVNLTEAGVVVSQSQVGQHRPPLGLLEVAAGKEDRADGQYAAVDLLQIHEGVVIDEGVVLVDGLDDAQTVAVVRHVLHAVDEHQVDQKAERRRNLLQRLVLKRHRQIPHATFLARSSLHACVPLKRAQ